jgi:hypothetical protein
VVEWSQLHQILDAQPVKGKANKGKYEFLLRWHNSTPGYFGPGGPPSGPILGIFAKLFDKLAATHGPTEGYV